MSQDKLQSSSVPLETLICVVTDAFDKYALPEYAIVFSLDIKEFLSSIKSDASKNEGFLQIVGNNQEVLLNYNHTGAAISEEDTDAGQCNIDGHKYSLTTTKSQYGNLKIIRGVRSTVFSDKIRSLMTIIQVYIAAALIISVLAALFFAYNQFAAVYRLFNVARENSDLPMHRNALTYIEKSFLRAVNNNASYREEIQKQKDLIKSSLIEKLFLTGIYTEDEKKELERYLPFSVEYYNVLDISIAEPKNLPLEQCNIIFSHVKDHIDSKYDFISMTHGVSELICLLNLDATETAGSDSLLAFIHETVGNVIEIFNTQLKVGISNIGCGINNIHTCYLQAAHAVRHMNTELTLPVSIFTAHKDKFDSPLNNLNPERQLYELIISNSHDDLTGLFAKIRRRLQSFAPLSEQDIMQMFFDLRSPIQNAAKTLLSPGETITLPSYSADSSIDSLLDALEEISLLLCSLSLKKKKSKNWALRESLLSYLSAEYPNPALCAAMVAEEFSLSEKYIFSFVKEQTELSFGKYVEKLRLEKACELLKTTEINATEIAPKIGFHSVNTFYKTFKRIFGTSPAEWKKNHTSE